jgi:hypothetical protein
VTTDYAYAVVRIVPDVERGEAVNAGVVLFARRARFLELRCALDAQRLLALAPDVDLPAVLAHLDLLQAVAAGDPAAGRVAELEPSERFGWLAAPSSTMVQPGPIHTGLTDDPAATLERLVGRLVRR